MQEQIRVHAKSAGLVSVAKLRIALVHQIAFNVVHAIQVQTLPFVLIVVDLGWESIVIHLVFMVFKLLLIQVFVFVIMVGTVMAVI